MQCNIHVTGFGRFNGVEDNPSTHIARAVESEVSSAQVVEVSARAADACLADLKKRLEPYATAENVEGGNRPRTTTVLLHFGVAASAPSFYLEQVGVNDASFRVPDEAGFQPRAQPIDDREPFASTRHTYFVAKALVERLLAGPQHKYPVQTSRDAGRFLCNYIYYRSLSLCDHLNATWSDATGIALEPAARLPPFLTLFVHVPSQDTVPLTTQFAFARDLIAEIRAAVAASAGTSGSTTSTAGAASAAAHVEAPADAVEAAAVQAAKDGDFARAAHLRGSAAAAATAAAAAAPETEAALVADFGFSLSEVSEAVSALGRAAGLEALAQWIVSRQEEEEGGSPAPTSPPADTAAAATATSGGGAGGEAPAAAAAAPSASLWDLSGAFAALSTAASTVSSGVTSLMSSAGATAANAASAGSVAAAAAAAALSGDKLKMVIVVREDLGMSIGKTAAQTCHAALKGARLTARQAGGSAMLSAWQAMGEPIVVLRCADLEALTALQAAAEGAGLVAATVRDAGRTEVAPGTVTVMAVGPAYASAIDAVTGKLRLL